MESLRNALTPISAVAPGVQFEELTREYREKLERIIQPPIDNLSWGTPLAAQNQLLASLQNQLFGLQRLTDMEEAIPLGAATKMLRDLHPSPLLNDLPQLKTLIGGLAGLNDDVDLELKGYVPRTHDASAAHRDEATLETHFEVGHEVTTETTQPSVPTPVLTKESAELLQIVLGIIEKFLIIYLALAPSTTITLTPEQFASLSHAQSSLQSQNLDTEPTLLVVVREQAVPLRADATARSAEVARVHPNIGGSDGYLRKVNSSGTLVWTR